MSARDEYDEKVRADKRLASSGCSLAIADFGRACAREARADELGTLATWAAFHGPIESAKLRGWESEARAQAPKEESK